MWKIFHPICIVTDMIRMLTNQVIMVYKSEHRKDTGLTLAVTKSAGSSAVRNIDLLSKFSPVNSASRTSGH